MGKPRLFRVSKIRVCDERAQTYYIECLKEGGRALTKAEAIQLIEDLYSTTQHELIGSLHGVIDEELSYLRSYDRRSNVGYLYLAKSKDNLYKIGRTQKPSERLKCLRRDAKDANVQLMFLMCVKDVRDLERQLHEQLTDFKEWGEWYRFSSDVLDRIIQWLDQLEEVYSEH
jgi:hypothetical protein